MYQGPGGRGSTSPDDACLARLTMEGHPPYGAAMAITKIQLFPVTNPTRSIDFLDTEMGEGQRWVQVRPPGAATSITLVTWFPTMPAGSIKGTVIGSDDLEADIADLRNKGVSLPGAIEEAPWGRYITFDDPDGNGLILQEMADRGRLIPLTA